MEEKKGSRDGNGRGKIRIVGLQGHPEFTTVSSRIAGFSSTSAWSCFLHNELTDKICNYPLSPVLTKLLPFSTSASSNPLNDCDLRPQAIVDRMISARSESGVLDTPTAEEARRRSSAQSGGEGRGVIGWGIWAVLLEL
jgi:hypothetical protein